MSVTPILCETSARWLARGRSSTNDCAGLTPGIAADASTGEQKALLIGLVLAHAGLLAEMTGFAPVVLLDEVVAHLDPSRRSALYTELEKLDAQTWMTGADAAVFAELAAKAEVFQVAPGEVTRRSD